MEDNITHQTSFQSATTLVTSVRSHVSLVTPAKWKNRHICSIWQLFTIPLPPDLVSYFTLVHLDVDQPTTTNRDTGKPWVGTSELLQEGRVV